MDASRRLFRDMRPSAALPLGGRSDAPAAERVRRRFREQARAFDHLYEDEPSLFHLPGLRPGLFRRRELAVDTVRAYEAPRVLDVGCGSGRIGEAVLEAGDARYLGIDFSEPMIDLARRRLAPYEHRAELRTGEFLREPIDGTFDVVLALGLFDYLPRPDRVSRRMFELCAEGGCLVASFPRWSPVKGPIRQIRYEWLGNCPSYNYSVREVELMLGASGFEPMEISTPVRSGCLVRAWRTA